MIMNLKFWHGAYFILWKVCYVIPNYTLDTLSYLSIIFLFGQWTILRMLIKKTQH